MPESFIMNLSEEQWNTRAQVMFSIALFDELLDYPERLADPAFTGYLLGALGPEAKMSRDMFIPVVVLGMNATLSGYIGLEGESDVNTESFFTPEDLAMPPAIVVGLNLQYLRSRDHARDVAKMTRLMTGGHVDRVDEGRLAIARAMTLAMASQSIPDGHRSNLLCLASFLQYMEGDQEGADMNAVLASMSDPNNNLSKLLPKLYATAGAPIWREVQKGLEGAV